MYIADQDVAEIARELTGSRSAIADQRRSPKHEIETRKLRALGMEFGGKPLLRATVAELVAAVVPSCPPVQFRLPRTVIFPATSNRPVVIFSTPPVPIERIPAD